MSRTTDFRAAQPESPSTYDQEVTHEYEIYDPLALIPFLDRLAGEGNGGELRALDLGCGTGAVTVHLLRRGFTVEAADISPDMVAVAREKVQRERAGDRVTFHLCDAADLPFGDCHFDLVTCQRVLHHIQDIGPVVTEVARVLKPGGSFYLSDVVADSTPVARVLRRLWSSLLGLRKPRRPRSPAPRQRAARDFTSLLDERGFAYETRFFTHVRLQRYLSTRQRELVIKVLSAPWRNRGDMLFVYARKRFKASA